MSSPHAPFRTGRPRVNDRGFTLIEILIVVGIIIILLALLLAALASFRQTAAMTSSMNNMRQVGTWMRSYSAEFREHIVPSRFDYSNNAYPGKVKSHPAFEDKGQLHQGTWADILWTLYVDRRYPEALDALGHDYATAAPDQELYEYLPETESPFRSAADNARNAPDGNGRPIHVEGGEGAHEAGLPGYFAANDFFRAVRDSPDDQSITYWTNGQIRAPDRSVYLVDSFYGEIIRPQPEPWDASIGSETIQVDFRYSGVCLMLFLDGHIDPVGPWETLADLEGPDGGRQLRITDPTRR